MDFFQRKVKQYLPVVTVSMASFLESVITPVPVDPLIVSTVLKHPQWKYRVVIWAVLASVLGAMVSYAIGLFAFATVGKKIVAFYHLEGPLEAFSLWVKKYGFYAMLAKPIIPLPFKFAAMVFGVVEYNFWLFVLASLISRPVRFVVIVSLALKFGMRYREQLLKHVKWLHLLYLLLVVIFLASLCWACQ